MTLQRGLAQEFGTNNINVNITNHTQLTIVFVNSALAEQSQEERASTARHVGEYVRDHYSRFDSLTTIAVALSRNRSAGPVSVTNTEVPFSFTPAELRRVVVTGTRDSTPVAHQPHN